jgi:hypothetical protein
VVDSADFLEAAVVLVVEAVEDSVVLAAEVLAAADLAEAGS